MRVARRGSARIQPLIIAAALLLARTGGAEGAVRFVVAPAAGFGNVPQAPYATPETAADRIDSALAVSGPGDTVKVAGRAGVSGLSYPENLLLPAGVALLGGYSVEGTPFAARFPDSLLSVIDGRSAGSAIIVEPGAGRSTLVEGLVIREGFAGRGGGVLAVGASPTIRDNVFYLNGSSDPQIGGGGAIRLEDGADALIRGNTFVQNTSLGQSGSIHMVNSSPEIVNNIFFQDLAGAAIQCAGASSPSIRSNDFFENRAGSVGGCEGITDSVLALSGNRFENPLLCDIEASRFTLFDESHLIGAGEGGATIGSGGPGCHARVKFVSGTGTETYPYATPVGAARLIADVVPLTVPGDTIRVASGEYLGRVTVPPGVVVEGSWNSIFTARRAGGEVSVLSDTTGAGPIVTFGADGGVPATFDGFVVTGGRSVQGSALLVTNASPVLKRLSVLLNEAPSGGAIHVSGGAPLIVNTLIALNAGSGVSCAGGASPQIRYSGFFGNSGPPTSGCPGTLPPTVLTADPFFCDAAGCTVSAGGLTCDYADGNFRIFAESPYAEAGEDGEPIGALGVGCNRPVHYASPTGGNRYPYTTVADAARTISDALDACSDGDTLRVAAGTYTEVVQMAPGVRLDGGWNAAFTARDPAANVTTIEGNVAGVAAVLAQGEGVDEAAVLSGFTVTHAGGVEGPGIEVRDFATPRIERNLIRGNTTSADGAGILVVNGAPTVQNNTIYQNRTTSGASPRAGGILVRILDPLTPLSLLVTRNILYDNDGGAGFACLVPEDRPYEGELPRGSVEDNLGFANEGIPGDPNPNFSAFCAGVGFNTVADPLFCDYAAGDLTICYNSPARVNACGDQFRGALPVGCICTTHTFYVKPGNTIPRYPYASGDCGAGRYADVSGLLAPGDTVRFSAGIVDEPFPVVPGVRYFGNYDPGFVERASETNLNGRGVRQILSFPPGIDTTTVIDGFNLTSGRAVRGGAIYVSAGASPILANLRFAGNVADSGGAAVYAAPGSAPRIRYGYFTSNRVPPPRSPVVTLDGAAAEVSNCTFFDNLTIGIDIRSGSPAVFNNILVRNDRGGILCEPGATPDLGQNLAFNNDDFHYSGCSDSVLALNLIADPLFCDEPVRRLTLFDHSPAAGAGRFGRDIGCFGVGCFTTRHFVSPTGTGPFPFVCPDSATPSLAAALAVAGRNRFEFSRGVVHDTVFVAGGEYNEDVTFPPNVVVLGGFPPDFGAPRFCAGFSHLTPGLRDPIRYPVIVRGTGTRSVAVVDSGTTVNNTLIEGLTFRGGRAEYGGGVLFRRKASAVMRSCTVDSSTATVAGGGVYVSGRAEPRLDFILAKGNAAPIGAALYADTTSSPAVRKWSAVGNAAGGGGGAIQFNGTGGEFTYSIVAYNQGIGVVAEPGTNLTGDKLTGLLFWENSVRDTLGLTPSRTAILRFGDPRFCDREGGDFRVYYRSPAVIKPCARPELGAAELMGAFPVGCTDAGHVFLVSVSGTPVYPFACAEAASRRVSDALARAQSGDSIRVSTGLYLDNIAMNARVVLEGGWSTSPAFVTRNPAVNRTVIQPPPQVQGIPIIRVESPKDELGGIIPEMYVDTTAVIDGLILEENDAALENGGGISCVDASPRISGNVIRKNRSSNFGGGISAIRTRDQVIRGNTIVDNRAAHGGGIYLGDCEDPVVEGNVVTANQAEVRGAGIRLAQHTGAALVHDNTVVSNKGPGGDGISFGGGSSASEIYNNIVAFNTRLGLERYPAPEGEPVPRQDHNLMWGNRGGNYGSTAAGEGDLFLDPLLCRPDSLDFRVQACSPAIGAGRDSSDLVIGYQGNAGPFCADNAGPSMSIAFLKNSVVPRFLDVYVNFSERIVDSTLVALRICENQAGAPLALARPDPGSSVYGVRGVETSGCGTLTVSVTAADACANARTFARSVSTAVAAPGAAARLASPDGAVRIEVAAAPAGREAVLFIAGAPSTEDPEGDEALALLGAPLGGAYEVVGLADLAGSGASLAFALPPGLGEAEAGAAAIYRRLGSGWVRVESWLDAGARAIVAHPEEDGLYRLVLTGDAAISPALPARTALLPSLPNPAPGAAQIAFDLAARAHATLRVFDASGRRVATLVDRTLPAGRHAFAWPGTDDSGRRLSSGVYFYELRAGSASETRKLVLIR